MHFKAKMGENATYPANNQVNENENNEEDMDQSDTEEDNEVDEEDCDDMTPEEFNALNNKMDELNSALDTIEQRNDVIYSELLKLLQANREIRQQMEGESSAEKLQPTNKK